MTEKWQRFLRKRGETPIEQETFRERLEDFFTTEPNLLAGLISPDMQYRLSRGVVVFNSDDEGRHIQVQFKSGQIESVAVVIEECDGKLQTKTYVRKGGRLIIER